MSLENSVEKLKREAMARSEFDNLVGYGKPIDLTVYFNTPEELRMAYSLLKSSKFIPEEVDLIRQVADLRKRLSETVVESERKAPTKDLNDKTLALDLAIERYKQKRKPRPILFWTVSLHPHK